MVIPRGMNTAERRKVFERRNDRCDSHGGGEIEGSPICDRIREDFDDAVDRLVLILSCTFEFFVLTP